MKAREAKRACATEGLWLFTRCRDSLYGNKVLIAWKGTPRDRDGAHYLAEFRAGSWPLAVAAFKGWRAEWLKQASR